MNKTLLTVLWLCSMLFLPFTLVPILAIYYSSATAACLGTVSPLPPLVLCCQLFFCELCGFAGNGCGRLADRWGMNSALRRILAALLGLAAAAAMYFLFLVLDPLSCVGMAILGSASFWVVGALRGCSYRTVLTLRSFYINLFLYSGVLILLEVFSINSLSPAVFAVFLFIELLLVLFGANQAGIDHMMERRHHRYDALPAKIRSYNIRLYAILAAVLFLLLILYRPIEQVLTFLGGVLVFLARWIVQTIFSKKEISDSAQSGTVRPGSDEGFSRAEGGEGSPLWAFFGIALALFVLWLIFINRHEIAQWLRETVRQLRDWFYRLFWGGKQRKRVEATEYYTETEEIIDHAETEEVNPSFRRDRARWRRECRRFSGESDSPEALRHGYRLILRGIRLFGLELSVSDTTLEIGKKASDRGLPLSDACTDGYNRLRYGEAEFDLHSMQEIRNALAELQKIKNS